MSDTLTFLEALWGDKPDGPAIQLWEKEKKLTSYFPSPATAATYAGIAAKHGDVYLAAGLSRTLKKPARKRAGNAEVVGIPGLWADIDVIGGPEAKTDAAPAKSAALELAYALLEPSLLVNSGYGIQAWWLFEEPWLFGTTDERERALQMSMAFQSALRTKAREAGFGLDATHDLARLMRLPGTLNHKGEPVAVQLLDDTEARYELDSLHEVGLAHMAEAGKQASAVARGDVDVEGIGEAPHERIMELMGIDDEFSIVWQKKKSRKTATWSQSSYDMSIASRLVNAGFTDQEIANAISYHRKKHNPADTKAERVDYMQRTISRARTTVEAEEAEEEFEQARTASINKLEAVASNGAAPASVTISLFNEVMGGPEIKEVIQDGRDPETTRYRAILADGTEVPLGSVEAFTEQRRFRNAFAVVTRYRPPVVKAAKWDKVIQALLNTATVREEIEDQRARRVVGLLEPYLESYMSTDKERACQVADPFEEDGIVYVALDPFLTWARKVRGERMLKPDLQLLMEAAGFERKAVNFHKGNGAKSSRSYYFIEKEVVLG